MSEHPESSARAVRWISDQRLQGDERPLHLLIDEASRRFDLTPKEEQGLLALLRLGEKTGD